MKHKLEAAVSERVSETRNTNGIRKGGLWLFPHSLIAI